ncbi:MAG TPA: hypothetical protein PLO64_05995 [Methanothermobacter sp.]|nr:glycosyltransferase [Methanothermobacter sp. MT-2]HOK73380.1 hypothetical protein [Methanothermobacter sp.]HOL69464.1 hypothetical protein [Methanothermobacter sp.]HPQ05077.1 hypothetical protein [Methanothermobacter sp.]HPU36890.1 hypothetical protein [Methanothermobacter sp.]
MQRFKAISAKGVVNSLGNDLSEILEDNSIFSPKSSSKNTLNFGWSIPCIDPKHYLKDGGTGGALSHHRQNWILEH